MPKPRLSSAAQQARSLSSHARAMADMYPGLVRVSGGTETTVRTEDTAAEWNAGTGTGWDSAQNVLTLASGATSVDRQSPALPLPSVASSSRIEWTETLTGMTALKLNTRLVVDGTDGGGQLALAINDTFTYEILARPTATTALPAEAISGYDALSNMRMAVFPQHGGNDAGTGLSVGTNGVCVAEHGSSYAPSVLTYATTISDWVRLSVVYNAGTPSLYINGVLVRTGLKSSRIKHPGAGFQPDFGAYLGDLADYRVWNKARTASEIQADMAKRLNGAEPGLVGYWPMDEGTGSTLVDKVNAKNLPLTGTAWGAAVDKNTLQMVSSLDNGATWTALTNGAEIPGVVAGADLAGKSLLLRQQFGAGVTVNSLTATVNGITSSRAGYAPARPACLMTTARARMLWALHYPLLIVSDAATQVIQSARGALPRPATPCFKFSGWADIPGATWVWDAYYANPGLSVDEVVQFARRFEDTVGGAATLAVCADNIVDVWLDGRWLARNADLSRVLTLPVRLDKGPHELRFVCVNVATSTTDPTSNPAGLIYKLSR